MRTSIASRGRTRAIAERINLSWTCTAKRAVACVKAFVMCLYRINFTDDDDDDDDDSFSNSLLIHEEKAKKITTVKEVWKCDLDYHKIC